MKKIIYMLLLMSISVYAHSQSNDTYLGETITFKRDFNLGDAMGFDGEYGILGNTMQGKVSVRLYADSPLNDTFKASSEGEAEEQGFMPEGGEIEDWGLLDEFHSEGKTVDQGFIFSREAVPKISPLLMLGTASIYGYALFSYYYLHRNLYDYIGSNTNLTEEGFVSYSAKDFLADLHDHDYTFKEKLLRVFAYKTNRYPHSIKKGTLAEQHIEVKIEIKLDPEVQLEDIQTINVHGEVITKNQLIQASQVFVHGSDLELRTFDQSFNFNSSSIDLNHRISHKAVYPENATRVHVDAYPIGTAQHYFYLAAEFPPEKLKFDNMGHFFERNSRLYTLYRIKKENWSGMIGGNGAILIGNNLRITDISPELQFTPQSISYAIDDDHLKYNGVISNNESDPIFFKNLKYVVEPLQGDKIEQNGEIDGKIEPGQSLAALDDYILYNNITSLEPGTYCRIYMTYDASLTLAGDFTPIKVEWPYYRRPSKGKLTTYDIDKEVYNDLPIYKVKGGMSMEYAVQKSIAALNHGLSHTWAVDSIIDDNGNKVPDLLQGPPLPVWGEENFLESSVDKTIELYNKYLPAGNIETLIIAPGVANVPYLSMAMQAPVLPLHFLVTTERLSDVKTILDQANASGYSTFATSGYDPSMPDLGVSWIKLLELPSQYLEFIRSRDVKNIVFIGAQDKKAEGETEGARLLFKDTDLSTTLGDYTEGDVYIMLPQGEEAEKRRIAGFSDYENLRDNGLIFAKDHILDWEASIADKQIDNFTTSIKKNAPNVTSIHALTANTTLNLYEMATYIMQTLIDKNSTASSATKASRIDLNEYLIGYPGFEFSKNHLPYLYWQLREVNELNSLITSYVKDIYRSNTYANLDDYVNEIPVHINAKHEQRKEIQKGLLGLGHEQVTINDWLKADVWDTSDGMTSPCEKVALEITTAGYESYKANLISKTYLTIDDVLAMTRDFSITQAFNRDPGHPNANNAKYVTHMAKTFGVSITEEYYDPSPYWQSAVPSSLIKITDRSGEEPEFIGNIGVNRYGNKRYQRVIITEFDLNDDSDEFDLDIGYRYNVSADNTNNKYKDYNPNLPPNQQNMGCFEWVKVPKNEWMDIPNRVMEREGALVIWNGTVYDFDYNGMPGVVPFIKMENPDNETESLIKAQPQILSYKAEAYFAWDWGTKTVSIGHRDKDIGGTDGGSLVQDLSNLYKNQTAEFPNAMSGMTYMSYDNRNDPNGVLDITRYQPDWMLEYEPFPDFLLGPSGSAVRCYTAPEEFETQCDALVEENGQAGVDDGYHNCNSLIDLDKVKSISALAYQQHDQLFDDVPNARTYIALSGDNTKLHIGIIDGDLGKFNHLGPKLTKTMGMHNWEVANFVEHKQYKHFMHLDGGSSSQMWIAGKGPLQDPDGYPLIDDNQGPYNSRLVSSYLMVKPKMNSHESMTSLSDNEQFIRMDNSLIAFDYPETERLKKKSYISLSPTVDLFRGADDNGSLMMNFRIAPDNSPEGAVLFAMGEDMYYPDTEGVREVIREARNLMVLGVGKIPQNLIDYINKALNRTIGAGNFHSNVPSNTRDDLRDKLSNQNDQDLYYISMEDGHFNKIILGEDSYDGWMDGNWHAIHVKKLDEHENVTIEVDGNSVGFDWEFGGGGLFRFSESTPINYAYLGAMNLDGRYITGNARLDIDNVLAVVGDEGLDALNYRSLSLDGIYSDISVPEKQLGDIYGTIKTIDNGVHFLQFEEEEGYHSFGLSFDGLDEYSSKEAVYGLNINTSRNSHNQASSRVADEEVNLEPEIEEGLKVYPNSTDEKLDIEYVAQASEQLTATLITLDGRVVMRKMFTTKEGLNVQELTIPSELSGGIYILRLSSSSINHTQRIIVSR